MGRYWNHSFHMHLSCLGPTFWDLIFHILSSSLITGSGTDSWHCQITGYHSPSWLLWRTGIADVYDILAEKAMTPHSSTLAWKIPWMGEPGRLQSMGSLRVGHDWATSLSLFTLMHWRRKWKPTPVLLSGESQGRGNLVGCRLWGRTESDTTEAT